MYTKNMELKPNKDIKPSGTKEELESLIEEFCSEYDPVKYPIQYNPTTEQYYQEVDGEYGLEYNVIDDKYNPIINNFIY